MYKVGFPHGLRYDLATHIIVESLFDSVSDNGDHYTYFDSIVDIRSTEDMILKDNGYFITPSNIKVRVIRTKGW